MEMPDELEEGPSLGEVQMHSFVIRLWLEARAHPDAPSTWRGRVIHVQSGRHLHFQDLATLVAFLHQQSGWPDPLPNDLASMPSL
ncbi:MAG: hypothetical protein RML36_09180 [Anaerolineae bacterium]|nr:hypothetical protein [Anaerolineae bacterium]MDW8099638.1 hypothetical protein [Anaerolineae bacterium]